MGESERLAEADLDRRVAQRIAGLERLVRERIDTLERQVTRLQADLDHRGRQLEAIRVTSDALFSHPSVDTMIEVTLRTALEVVRADSGTVFLHDPSRDALVFRYVIGSAAEKLIGQEIPSSKGGVAWTVFRTARPDLIGDVTTRGDFNRDVDRQTGYHTRSMMTVPVKRASGTSIGVMQVLNARVAFTRRDLEVLEVLCAQAATGIEHAQLLEDQRRAEIGNRVGEIAHDIKNMMTPIETGVLTLEPVLDDAVAHLRRIAEECPAEPPWRNEIDAAIQLIAETYPWLLNDLLTAAKRVRRRTEYIAGLVKGQLPPPVFEEGDLHAVIQDVIKTLARVARERGVLLQTELDPALPRTAFDYDRLYDALYNLVSNALPETPPGGSVTVRTIAPTASQSGLTIQVQDTGRGIPPHVLERLFTSSAISTKVGGTGLGTGVAARIVREHGGEIAVASELGHGATFTLSLPLERPLFPAF